MKKAGFEAKETRHVQFAAWFKLDRYVRSVDEMDLLRTSNLDLWNDLQRCIRSKEIEREFLLLVEAKKT
jgi:hypothetical protein